MAVESGFYRRPTSLFNVREKTYSPSACPAFFESRLLAC